MIARTFVALGAGLAASLLLSGAPAKAFTARQATAGGQGIYATSSGTPQNVIPSGPVAPPHDDAGRRPLRSLEHHDRYFAGF